MNYIIIIPVALIIFSILLFILSYFLEKKEKQRKLKVRETAAYSNKLSYLEDLLFASNDMPYSRNLQLALLNAKKRSCEQLLNLNNETEEANTKKVYEDELKIVVKQIKEALNGPHTENITTYLAPTDERSVRRLLGIIKRLHVFLKQQLTKGQVVPAVYNQEVDRLNQLRVLINLGFIYAKVEVKQKEKHWRVAQEWIHRAQELLVKYAPENAEAHKRKVEGLVVLNHQIRDEEKEAMKHQGEEEKSKDNLENMFKVKSHW